MLKLASDGPDVQPPPEQLAPAALCERWLGPLQDWADNTFPDVDPHYRTEAVHDALLFVGEHPEKYDSTKGEVFAFLKGVMRNRLRKCLSRERKRRLVPFPDGFVELAIAPGQQEEDDRPARLERAVASAALDPREQQVLKLMCAGVRDTSVYATLLRLDGPREVQKREVKRVKDRIKKRLQREGGTDDPLP